MKIEELLADVGFSERESRVYLALLELGSTTTGPLVKKSGVPNSKVYEILESLQKKGLVSWIVKGKTKYFQGVEPKKILGLFREKEREIEKCIPFLESKRLEAKERSSVELFECVPAIRNMFITMISDARKGECWYGFSTGTTSSKEEIRDFYEWWGKRKVKLKDHLLISKEHRAEFEKAHHKSLKDMKNILRYSNVAFPGDVAIFRSKVVILNWEDTPTATLITSKNIAKQYKDFFVGLWNKATAR